MSALQTNSPQVASYLPLVLVWESCWSHTSTATCLPTATHDKKTLVCEDEADPASALPLLATSSLLQPKTNPYSKELPVSRHRHYAVRYCRCPRTPGTPRCPGRAGDEGCSWWTWTARNSGRSGTDRAPRNTRSAGVKRASRPSWGYSADC